MSDSNAWNARYGETPGMFGEAANEFLMEQAHRLRPGMAALALGDGEGRNGVWLAGQGLDVTAHARNFFDSVKSRQPTVANPEVMRNSHVACHAAALSWILKRKLTFDPANQAFVNDDEANRLRTRPARTWT